MCGHIREGGLLRVATKRGTTVHDIRIAHSTIIQGTANYNVTLLCTGTNVERHDHVSSQLHIQNLMPPTLKFATVNKVRSEEQLKAVSLAVSL